MMLYEELFIDGKTVDIKGVEIERTYETPFFSDITKILSDSTKTIKLPETERNKAVMEYLHSADMNTDFPYTFHYADYYLNGMQLIKNGEVKVLGDFEIQIVYGVNRAKYLPLKETKLNEIEPNGTTILESDWVAQWSRGNGTDTGVYNVNGKYRFYNYVSAEKTFTRIYDAAGNLIETVYPQEPYASNLKEMTLHPFIKFSDILDLINTHYDLNIDLIPIKKRLQNVGLILTGNNDNKVDSTTRSISGTYTRSTLRISSLSSQNMLYTIDNNANIKINKGLLHIKYPLTITLELNITISNNISKLLIKSVKLGVAETYLTLPYTTSGSNLVYSGSYDIVLENDVDYYYFAFDVGTVNYIASGNIIMSLIRTSNVYNLYDGLIERFNCLLNLPKNTAVDFFSDINKLTCLNFSYDINGDLKFISFEEFKNNMNNGNVYDWSGKVSNIKKSEYKFNSNAQKNAIRYNNSDSLNYNSIGYLSVNDFTLTSEKDLHVIGYDAANKSSNNTSEVILYKLKIDKRSDTEYTFDIDYTEKPNTIATYAKALVNDYTTLSDIQDASIEEYLIEENSIITDTPYLYDFPIISVISQTTVKVDTSQLGGGNISNYIKVNDSLLLTNSMIVYPNVKVSNIDDLTSTITFDSIITASISVVISNYGLSNKCKILNGEEYYLPILEGFEYTTELNMGTDILFTCTNNDGNGNFTFDKNVFLPYSYSPFQQIYSANALKKDIISRFYQIYQKLINRPIVKEVDVLLDFYESSQIDFTKPIYIKEWGKYCMLLELNASNKGLSKAKLLLINQTL